MAAVQTRGAFIVFEGLDRSGKSTQAARLEAKLREQGVNVRSQKFPDRTTAIGKMIDGYLQNSIEMDDRAIHMLFCANRWECAAQIRKDLESGVTIIADRYAFSGAAFTAAKGIDLEWSLRPDTGLPVPDLTLYLTLPALQAAKRADFGAERYEKQEFQETVAKVFERVRDRVIDCHGQDKWSDLVGEGSVENVGDMVWERVLSVLENRTRDSGSLWEKS